MKVETFRDIVRALDVVTLELGADRRLELRVDDATRLHGGLLEALENSAAEAAKNHGVDVTPQWRADFRAALAAAGWP